MSCSLSVVFFLVISRFTVLYSRGVSFLTCLCGTKTNVYLDSCLGSPSKRLLYFLMNLCLRKNKNIFQAYVIDNQFICLLEVHKSVLYWPELNMGLGIIGATGRNKGWFPGVKIVELRLCVL